MRRIEGPDELVVIYEMENGRRVRFDRLSAEKFGVVNLLLELGFDADGINEAKEYVRRVDSSF